MIGFFVSIKEDFFNDPKNEWIKKTGLKSNKEYEVLGSVGDKLLLKVEKEFVEIFSRHLIFSCYKG